MNTKLKLLSAVCVASMFGNVAMAEGDKVELSGWDADSNATVSQEEWADQIDTQGLFDNIDKNNNGIYDIEEASEADLDYDVSMDIDAGGNIDRDEFAIGLYNKYDANDDDMLDETEFGEFATLSDSPLFMKGEESSEN